MEIGFLSSLVLQASLVGGLHDGLLAQLVERAPDNCVVVLGL